METKPKWAFIFSVRFWVMVVGIVSVYAQAKGWIGEPERNAIAAFSAAFLTVGTVDRIGDKKVEAAKIISPVENDIVNG